MHPEMTPYRVSIIRGGTSKGIFIMQNELPEDPEERERMICAIFGSPDVRQIDGLGGADVLTSKVAIIGPPTRPDADVDYTFGQVSFVEKKVDFKGNCGNISSAVGGFAIDEGLVKAVAPVTKVRIHQTNSNTILNAEVPVTGGKAAVLGDCSIDGVPGTGAKIVMDWAGAIGGQTGKLLPTGNPVDEIKVDGESYAVSLVDAGNPLIFINAEALGLIGTETPSEIEGNEPLMKRIEQIRGHGAVIFGLTDKPEHAEKESPYSPFFAIVSKSADYKCFNDTEVSAEEVDIVARLVFMQHMHKTYPISGTVCTGAASRVPGSIVYDLIDSKDRNDGILSIGHPGGVIRVETEADYSDGIDITKIGVYRTARRIMDGYVYVSNNDDKI